MAPSAWYALPWHSKHQKLQRDHFNWDILFIYFWWWKFRRLYFYQLDWIFGDVLLISLLSIVNPIKILRRKLRNCRRKFKRGKDWTYGVQILKKNMKIGRTTYTRRRHTLICNDSDWYENYSLKPEICAFCVFGIVAFCMLLHNSINSTFLLSSSFQVF